MTSIILPLLPLKRKEKKGKERKEKKRRKGRKGKKRNGNHRIIPTGSGVVRRTLRDSGSVNGDGDDVSALGRG